MAGSSPNQDIFDVRRIRRLAELMNEHGLVELDVHQGETRIRIRRDVESVVGGNAVRTTPAAPPLAPPEPPKAAAPLAAVTAIQEEHIKLIKSPMVGTVYLAPAPDLPPYVKVGDAVGMESTVCVVEAMKVFNEIPAEVSGKIVAVLVDNGDPVEYGQPLFKVDTRP